MSYFSKTKLSKAVGVMKHLSKHDQYVSDLCERIKEYYDDVIPNYKIAGAKRCFGEVDILAKRGEQVDLYEVKCSHRPIKARKQLTRLRRYFGAKGDSFFYCGTSGLLMLLQI